MTRQETRLRLLERRRAATPAPACPVCRDAGPIMPGFVVLPDDPEPEPPAGCPACGRRPLLNIITYQPSEVPA